MAAGTIRYAHVGRRGTSPRPTSLGRVAEGESMIRLYETVADARVEVLGKRSPASVDLPPAVKDRIREVFGADLSAAEVVQRVLDDVREQGDAAVRRYTKAFDGADIGDLQVDDAE